MTCSLICCCLVTSHNSRSFFYDLVLEFLPIKRMFDCHIKGLDCHEILLRSGDSAGGGGRWSLLTAAWPSLRLPRAKLLDFGENVASDGGQGLEARVVEGGGRVAGGEVGDPPHGGPRRGRPVRGSEGQAVIRSSVEQLEVDSEVGAELAGLAEVETVHPHEPVRGGDEGGDAAHQAPLPPGQEDLGFPLAGPAGHGENTEQAEQWLGVRDVEQLLLQLQAVPGLSEVDEAGAGQLSLPEELELAGLTGSVSQANSPAPLGWRPPQRKLAGEQTLRPECLHPQGVDCHLTWLAGRIH